MKRIACYLIGMFLCLAIGYGIGHRSRRAPSPGTIVTRIDTLMVYDTLRLTEFREVKTTIVDTFFVAVPSADVSTKSPFDSVLSHFPDAGKIEIADDSVMVALPLEQTVIRDSLFTAQISGYKARLDWIDIIAPTRVITLETTRYEAPKKWSLGATLGPSVLITPNGKIYGGIGLTAGVTYRF